jgi:hypothetical protein
MSLINLVQVLVEVGYSEVSVKGQKTKLVKATLGYTGEQAKAVMFNKQEVLTVLNKVGSGKTSPERASKALALFDLVSAEQYKPEWLEEPAQGQSTTAAAKKTTKPRKGTVQDLREFVAALDKTEDFQAWLQAKYSEGGADA